MLRDIADEVEFKAWRNPDEMRSGLTSGTMQAVVVPTQVAANLFNRGLGVRLLNTMTDGLLYLVSADPALGTIEALRGRKIALPFRNDTPEFVFNRLLKDKGMVAGKDLTVETTGTPIEAMQLLLAGRLDAALVPEPAATAAIVRGKLAGKTIARVMDVQKLWGVLDPASKGLLPQAGLAVTDAFRTSRPDLVERLHEQLTAAAAAVRSAPAVAANNAAAALELPWSIVEESVAWSKLECRRARDCRPYLESMFKTIAEADPSLLGGKLPAEEFYL
jgi:NitT/TauT family transport system substrate-binding protein